MIHINCDLGERGYPHEVDLKLLEYVDMINIAMTGHAGDKNSVNHWWEEAIARGKEISLHISYKDKANFGRVSRFKECSNLRADLYQQRVLLEEVTTVKFHGALYNDAAENEEVAEFLYSWLVPNEIEEVVITAGSRLHNLCVTRFPRIKVKREAFIDRRYTLKEGKIALVSRESPFGVIKNLADALEQASRLKEESKVQIINPQNGEVLAYENLYADTFCIHSDNPNAIEIVKGIRDADL